MHTADEIGKIPGGFSNCNRFHAKIIKSDYLIKARLNEPAFPSHNLGRARDRPWLIKQSMALWPDLAADWLPRAAVRVAHRTAMVAAKWTHLKN
jgi:hypothetical protein